MSAPRPLRATDALAWAVAAAALAIACAARPAGAQPPATATATADSAAVAVSPAEPAQWTSALETFAYLMDDGFVMPIATADRGALHLEARYQYEDLDTFSAWAGRRITTGTTLELDVVAMAGAIVGETNGIAPGLEASLAWKSLELYAETEYVFDLESDDGDYLYTWSTLSWSAAPWLSLGLAAQRTRTYQSELDIERGLFASARRGIAELSVYGFNLDGDDPFAIVALGLDLAH